MCFISQKMNLRVFKSKELRIRKPRWLNVYVSESTCIKAYNNGQRCDVVSY
jgi:hypothetical protein